MPWAYPMGAFFLSWSLPMTLLGKRPIISTVANPLFRMSACVVLVCALAAASMVPMLGQFAPVQFSHDFIAVAYTLGLARIALMIAAMDVGSAFEGMGYLSLVVAAVQVMAVRNYKRLIAYACVSSSGVTALGLSVGKHDKRTSPDPGRLALLRATAERGDHYRCLTAQHPAPSGADSGTRTVGTDGPVPGRPPLAQTDAL